MTLSARAPGPFARSTSDAAEDSPGPADPQSRWWGPAWPVTAFLLGFPLWWLLGATSFILVLLAIPMGLRLLRLKRIQVPPAFGWWLLFLLCVLGSAVMLGVTAPHTVPGSLVGRLPGYTLRLFNYLAATILMLFIINMPERELSTRRLVRMLGGFFVVVVVGGLAGTFLYNIQFTSPVELLLPKSLTSYRFVASSVHPAVAQVQGVLGYESPRPTAPFIYTNDWGNNFLLLAVWFVVANGLWGSLRRRVFCVVVLAVSLVPIVYSINRGLWIGLLVAVAYVSVRSALHGRADIMVGFVLVTGVILIGIVVSPLSSVIQERLTHPHSNTARENTSVAAVRAAVSSPVLGYGSTRAVVGSAQSIAVGRSSACPQCGNAAIGGAGQLWLLLVAQGFLGTVLYVGFFVRTLWIYRRDRSAVPAAATLVIGLGLVYVTVYAAVGTALGLYMIAVALLWRHRRLDEQSSAARATGALVGSTNLSSETQ